MPRTEPIRRDPWERWKGMTDEDIAARLSGTKAVCRQTVTKWRKDPDVMPLWAFARINRILEIEAEAARQAVVVIR